jgi:hypothetical protein
MDREQIAAAFNRVAQHLTSESTSREGTDRKVQEGVALALELVALELMREASNVTEVA